jgi:MFS transporter, DHA1 family, tetracycline resistance protein
VPVLFLIVFIDLLGFGILLPLFPFVAEQLGASPFWITFGGSGVYALCQFIATPFWGQLSDRFGRKPILIGAMLGSACSFFMLAYADSLALLIIARAVGGVMAGNISAAFAYVSDVTTVENRARGLGLLGAALGLGFTLGPFLGGVLGGEDKTALDFHFPAMVATCLSLVASAGAYFFLRESHPTESRQRHAVGVRTFWPFAAISGNRATEFLLLSTFAITVSVALMQSVFPIWSNALYGFGPRTVGSFLLFLGVLSVFCQGFLVHRLSRFFGEQRLAIYGCVAFVFGLALMAAFHSTVALVIGLTILGAGFGVVGPCLSTMISFEATAHGRGAAMGAYNAASSLGRVFGPTVSGLLYSHMGHSAPLFAGALVAVPAAFLAGRARIARSRAKSVTTL